MELPVNKIICGSALEVLKTLPDNSINCCISSPPYWGLCDYGVDGQLGLESTFEEYLDKLLAIYDEVFRVLRKDGTCFVNLSDTYFGSGKGLYGDGTSHGTEGTKQRTNVGSVGVPNVKSYGTCDIKFEDYLNYDFLLKNLCDVCLKSYLIGIIHNSNLLFSKQSLSLSLPSQENTEVLSSHYSSSDSLPQDFHTSNASLDFQHLINLSVEQLVSFFLSKLPSSFVEFQGNVSNHNHVEKCPYCGYLFAGDAIPFGRKADNTKRILLLASFLAYHKNNNHNVYPYHDYNRSYQSVKPKSLCMIPERFAIGMIERGWILRNKIVWAKGNPMPESCTDRFTKSHEIIYFFVKNKKYYFDNEAVKEDSVDAESYSGRRFRGRHAIYESGAMPGNNPNSLHSGGNHNQGKTYPKRNRRDVWNINVVSGNGIHFACFPDEIPKLCIKAGCPENGIVMDMFCGSGTVCYVAAKLKRDYIGIELNPKYIEEIANYRVQEAETSITVTEQRQGQKGLFNSVTSVPSVAK